MRQKNCLLLTLLLLWTPCVVVSQVRSNRPATQSPSAFFPLDPRLYGITAWRVGESSEYLLVSFQEGQKEVKRLRYAVLSEERISGTSYFVVENQVTGMDESRHMSVNSVTRPFGDLTNLLEGAQGNIVVKQDDAPARSIPLSFLKDQMITYESRLRASTPVSIESYGEEVVEMNAGKFKTTHQRIKYSDGHSADVWWSGSVGPLGLVKVVSKNFSLDLLQHQTKHSTSAITELPTPLPDK